MGDVVAKWLVLAVVTMKLMMWWNYIVDDVVAM